MPTFFSKELSDRLYRFSVSLAAAGRLFTADQLARHPDLSNRKEPVKRAREFLSKYPDTFETLLSPSGVPARRRLTKQARRKYGFDFRPVNGVSQRAEHWLGIGDIWLRLTFFGGRPEKWITEPDKQFDVMCKWRGQILLIEYQRTPITSKVWASKWKKRREWWISQKWNEKPIVILVDETRQDNKTISAPLGTAHVKSIDEFPYALARRIQR
ncbi:hypothetical protein [Alicyclobacillus fastidiosus]|uniref:Transposase n=1 Tax=Alicyclobacillus fastidiosus TaxID=392011 RepID=A0ABV5ALT4_9BACL|nr:hypothetical protein [Alicyclobacillus fastidiosus]WEH10997.1 hypothetical protein PYS47_07205 [Alicyclobacillus fastidiosus]